MLLKYEFENFNSFKDKASFSMIAPANKVKNRFPDNYVSLTSGYDVQKTAVIVGENAGGKSNFVRSLEFLNYLFSNNDVVKTNRLLINSNNLDKKCPNNGNTAQRYYVEVTDDDDLVYIYELVFDFWGIEKETLNVRKSKTTKEQLVFNASRKKINVECDSDKCEHETCHINGVAATISIQINDPYLNGFDTELFERSTSEKNVGLYVTKLAILGCKPAMIFVDIMKNQVCPESNRIDYDIYKRFVKNENDLQILKDERFFDIFRNVDYSIKKIDIDEEEPFSKSSIYREGRDGILFSREISKDSRGVAEFFAWSVQLFKVIFENKIVFADEMDRVLNPILSDRVISLVNGTDHKGQFVFTTHNVLHLDLKNYMKEQIYFVTKDVETLESEMYSLSDFPEMRYETSKVYEFYLKGILGGTASE